MVRRIYTYPDIGSLRDMPYYSTISKLPHLVSSFSLKQRLENCRLFDNIMTAGEIINDCFETFGPREIRINDMAVISNYLHNRLLKSNSETESIWLQGCIKETYSF